jgi:hypothetical protein
VEARRYAAEARRELQRYRIEAPRESLRYRHQLRRELRDNLPLDRPDTTGMKRIL